MNNEPYKVTDNSGSFTGRGWRVSGPDGFEVFSDHQLTLAGNVAHWKNSSHKAACRMIAKMLLEQVNKIKMLNLPGIPQSFVDKHNIEITILEHAAKVVMRNDLSWNAQALESMNNFINEI